MRNEALTPARAAGLGVGNALFSSANTLLFATGATTTAAGRDCARATLGVGAALYVLGMAVETCAEVQRKSFKAVKGNEARLCTRGLWGVVRHANYAGDALWRAGFAVAAGGWTWGAVTGLCTLGYFAWRATPALEERCEAKVSWLRGWGGAGLRGWGADWCDVVRRAVEEVCEGYAVEVDPWDYVKALRKGQQRFEVKDERVAYYEGKIGHNAKSKVLKR